MPRGAAEYGVSCSQIFLPVSASMATTRLYGVARYMTFPTTNGVVLDCRTRGVAGAPRPLAEPSGAAGAEPLPRPPRPRPGGSTTGASGSKDQASWSFVT